MAQSASSGREAVWRERFVRFQKTGLSVARFCAREQVSVPAFYQWRKKLAVREPSRDESRRQNSFAPVRLVGTTCLKARWPGGTTIEIPLGDPRTPELLEWLQSVDARQARHAGGDAC